MPGGVYGVRQEPGRGWRGTCPVPGSGCCGLLAVRLVRGSLPSTKARARSDRRRLRDLAKSRKRLNAR
jgi:hypothetical protein